MSEYRPTKDNNTIDQTLGMKAAKTNMIMDIDNRVYPSVLLFMLSPPLNDYTVHARY